VDGKLIYENNRDNIPEAFHVLLKYDRPGVRNDDIASGEYLLGPARDSSRLDHIRDMLLYRHGGFHGLRARDVAVRRVLSEQPRS